MLLRGLLEQQVDVERQSAQQKGRCVRGVAAANEISKAQGLLAGPKNALAVRPEQDGIVTKPLEMRHPPYSEESRYHEGEQDQMHTVPTPTPDPAT